MAIIRSIIILLLFVSPVAAADLYYAQSAAGAGNGSSCVNAAAISGMTWVAGNTNHICGTITSALTAGGSGSTGNPITIKFEDDAKFSKNYWTGGAVIISGRSFIVIDGGTNGIIEATDNGTPGTYNNQANSCGISASSAVHDIEIKNLTIRNMYVRTSTSDWSMDYESLCGIAFWPGMATPGNISIHGCTFSHVPKVIAISYSSSSNLLIYNNNFYGYHTGLNFGENTASSVFTGLYVYNNIFNYTSEWDGSDNSERYHADSIHTWSQQSSTISTVRIYGNTFGPKIPHRPDLTYSSAPVYLTDTIDDTMVYNNLFLLDAGEICPSMGFIYYSAGSTNLKVMNNTFLLNDTTGGKAVLIDAPQNQPILMKNNFMRYINLNIAGAHYNPVDVTRIDYNAYYQTTGFGNGGVDWSTWAGWGYDAHGSNGANPSLDGGYVPTSGDTVLKDKGVDLSAYFTTDKAGNTRTGTWDIGAYEYGAGGPDETPPTLSTKTISTSGTSLTLAFSEAVAVGAGGNGGWTIAPSGSAATLTYASGSGSTSLVYTISRTILSGETATVSYTQPGNGIEDGSGNDLATLSNSAVTNNSTQSASGKSVMTINASGMPARITSGGMGVAAP